VPGYWACVRCRRSDGGEVAIVIVLRSGIRVRGVWVAAGSDAWNGVGVIAGWVG